MSISVGDIVLLMTVVVNGRIVKELTQIKTEVTHVNDSKVYSTCLTSGTTFIRDIAEVTLKKNIIDLKGIYYGT